MSRTIGSIDLSSATVGATGTMDWSGQGLPAQGGPVARLQLFNESGCGLDLTLNASGRTFHLPAGGWTQDGVPMAANDRSLTYRVTSIIPNAPITQLTGVYYGAGEAVMAVVLGNSPIGISGSVSTSNIQSLKNDGQAPATSIVEATPSDQAVSSVSLNNDASGFLQVLSANVLRKILNVVRGNSGAGKAAITLGDSGDTSITTLYGTIGAGSVVPPATMAAGTLPSGVAMTAISSDGGAITSDGSGDITLNNGTASTPHFQVSDGVNNDIAWMDIVGEQMRIVTIYRGGGGRVSFAVQLSTNIASVSQGVVCGLRSAGGGAAGVTNWEGTLDPGASAGEGDTWDPQ